MALTSAQRVEVAALKTQYEQALRLLERRPDSPIAVFLREVTTNTGKRIKLEVHWVFTNEPDERYPTHAPPFADFEGTLKSALFRCLSVAEYSSCRLRYKDFQGTRPDFHLRIVMTEPPADPQRTTVGPASRPRNNEITANDRRFLRSLRIAADGSAHDDPTDEL